MKRKTKTRIESGKFFDFTSWHNNVDFIEKRKQEMHNFFRLVNGEIVDVRTFKLKKNHSTSRN